MADQWSGGIVTGVLSMMVGGVAGFAPITRSYTSPGSATETIPLGAHTMIREVVGGGGAGSVSGGNGGGAGGYCRSSDSVIGQGGKTVNYTVPIGGTAGGNGGNGSTSSGTFSVVTMTANGGIGATAGGAGAGGTATGGNVVNTTGNSGSGATPGSGTTTVYGGGPYGGGGIGGADGHNGAVIFHYL